LKLPGSTAKVARNAAGLDGGFCARATIQSRDDWSIAANGDEMETTLTTKSNEAKARAEASFRKEQRAKEGAKAMMEYQANSRMVREKMERLKALRLAKEAADKEREG
jgi:hypothetical protein